jgi:hypothetical protein
MRWQKFDGQSRGAGGGSVEKRRALFGGQRRGDGSDAFTQRGEGGEPGVDGAGRLR